MNLNILSPHIADNHIFIYEPCVFVDSLVIGVGAGNGHRSQNPADFLQETLVRHPGRAQSAYHTRSSSGRVVFFPVILITMCLMLGIRYYLGYPIENLSPNVVFYEFLFFAVGCMTLYLTGVTDDLIGVGYRYKFLVQIAAALLLVWSGEWFNSLGGLFGIYGLPVYIGVPVTLLVVVYITNAINLIDGIDGLASGLCCIALVVLGMMCTLRGEYIFAMLAFTTFGVIVPFWFYNVFGDAQRGHKLFMGDAGSLTLGYIISLLVIHLSRIDMSEGETGQVNLVLAFSTLIMPLFDVVRVVMLRVREGKNPFMPDKNHFHHKLLRMGMRPRIVMVTILFVALFLSC